MEAQCGFRQGRSTVDQIWVVRQVIEKATEYRTPVHLCFVDLTKAYDSVDRTALAAVLRSYGDPINWLTSSKSSTQTLGAM